MNKISSRRLFIKNMSFVSLGAIYLCSTNDLNALNPKNLFPGYNPYSPYKTDLRDSKFFGDHLNISGRIYSKKDLSLLEKVRLEVWHLSPISLKYRHHGKLEINSNGEYFFLTDFPGKENGKSARIYFKLSNENSSYTTQLLVTRSNAFITGDHWKENQILGDQLLPVKNNTNIQFNLTL
ncbi:MAG: hypothetical protein ABJ092_15020 [Gillisia sp.]